MNGKKPLILLRLTKNSKQIVNNYRLVSLLLRTNDSCIIQLISITHSIFCGFDATASLEVCAVFLDLSKAFDKVCHEGLLYRLQNNGIDGNLLCLIKSFLHNRHQRIILDSQSSI